MSLSFFPGSRQDNLSMSNLIRELFSKLNELISTQLELTKTEIKVESRKLITAASFGAAALAIAFISMLFLGVSLILLLAQAVGIVWATVITTALYFVFTGLAVLMMLSQLKKNSDHIEIE